VEHADCCWISFPSALFPSPRLVSYILKTNTKFELYLEMKNQPDFVAMRTAKETREREKRERAEARLRKAQGLPDIDEQQQLAEQQAAAAAQEQQEEKKEDAAGADAGGAAAGTDLSDDGAVIATGAPSAQGTPILGPVAGPPALMHSHSMPDPLPVFSLDDSEIGLRSPAASASSSSQQHVPLETPLDALSPTHCIDYEKLFPELPVAPKLPKTAVRRTVGAAAASSSARGSLTPLGAAAASRRLPPPGAVEAFQRSVNSGRRMSEPALFSLGTGFVAAHGSNPSSGRTSPQRQQQQAGRGAMQQRRLSGSSAVGSSVPSASSSSSSSSSSLPASASNLHLHQTRTNAINRMLKEHAESMISEGKDIFLLCAQRKRSWTGNAYLLSSSRDDIRAEGPHFYGKLKSNFGGTEFVVTDNGARAPAKKHIEPLQARTYPTYNAMQAAQQRQMGGGQHTPHGGVAGWLAHATASAPVHVRHELAAVLYDHFFGQFHHEGERVNRPST
jgi:hypothetical protein